jgi:hypothetical protein
MTLVVDTIYLVAFDKHSSSRFNVLPPLGHLEVAQLVPSPSFMVRRTSID